MKFPIKLLIFLSVTAAFVLLWRMLGLHELVTLEALQSHTVYFKEMVAHHYIISAAVFIGVFSAFIAAAVPVSPPLTLLGSYLFGFLWGFLYAFISCMIGAISSYLVIRYVVNRWLTGHHTERVAKFSEQFHKYGASYLLMLHFLSIIPYIVITILAALARVPLFTYAWTLALGSIPLLAMYSWTGSKLATLSSFKDILTPQMMIILGVLILLAIMPIFMRRFKHKFGL